MFYLDSDFMPKMRWAWADKVDGVGRAINHTGWYTDDDGSMETIRGILFRLNHGRGFLAGWSFPEGMIGEFSYKVYGTEREAAYAADSIAESVAEKEREANEAHYQEQLAEEKAEEEKREAQEMVDAQLK